MKMTIHKAGWLIALTGILTACNKNEDASADSYKTNGIAAVVSNNFSLASFNYAIAATGYDDTLSAAGPFTLIGPSNTAFSSAGFTTGAAIIRAADSMRTIVPYHILRGRVRLDSLPLAFNQVFNTINGQPLYITRWINSRDTAIVVNGARINTNDKPAANGLLNITDVLLFPSVYTNVQQAVSGDPSLTLFNAAIMRSGLAATLQSGGPYTVFAPVNAAFNAIGITTTDSIYKMDPVVLQNLVKAHIAGSRHFVYDYILQANTSNNTYTQSMLSGGNVTITLIASTTLPGRFSGITIKKEGSAAVAATLSKINGIAGNGVVHTISTLITQ